MDPNHEQLRFDPMSGRYLHIPTPTVDLPDDIYESPTSVVNSGFMFDVDHCSGDLPTISSECLDVMVPIFTRVKSEPRVESVQRSSCSYPASRRSPFGNADSTLSSSIPSKENWLGMHNFDLKFTPQPLHTVSKSASWTYSEEMDKLYVSMNVQCVLAFTVDETVPPGCLIRAQIIFAADDSINEVVRRCPVHFRPGHATNQGHTALEHVVRCSNSQAQYVCHDITRRYSVIVPLETPEAGTNLCKYAFSFVCLNSCPGGINRRPVMLIFTLEHCGEVLGRRAMHLRVCACPGRDRRMDERDRGTPQVEKNGGAPLVVGSRGSPPVERNRGAPQVERVRNSPQVERDRNAPQDDCVIGQSWSAVPEEIDLAGVANIDEINALVSSYNSAQSSSNQIFLIPVKGRDMLEKMLRSKAGFDLTPQQLMKHYEQDPLMIRQLQTIRQPPMMDQQEASDSCHTPSTSACTSASPPKAKKRPRNADATKSRKRKAPS